MERLGTFLLRASVIVALSVLVAVTASAQFQTGNIYGSTTSSDGSAIPGATVTLTGVAAPQTTVTDAQGRFRFLNLSPGTYSLRAELSGMGAAVRNGIGVRVGANADVEMVLSPSVSEAITVSASAPLLDVRKSGTGATMDSEFLQELPTARDPWMILQATPGVMVDRINTGGTQSGQQSVYVSKGAPRADGTWNVDGVNITDMGATGSSPTYYDFDTFEEMQITTGGSDPRIQTAGVQMNMVTKRGTNEFNGTARYLYVPGSGSAEATVPGEAAGYLSATNSVNYVRDYGAELGGPIWRDRAWLWLARGDQKISTWQSMPFPRPSFFIPDDTVLRNKNAKLNVQVIPSNNFVAAYTYGDKYRNARDLSPLRPYESAWTQTGPTEVLKFEDTQLIGSNLYLSGMWSEVKGGFGLFGNGGYGASAPSLWFDSGNVAHDNYYTFSTDRPQEQMRLDGSFVTDIAGINNEFKFGYGFRDTPVTSSSVYPGAASGYWDYSFGQALCTTNGLTGDCGVAVLIRPPQASYSGEYKELYVGDTLLLGSNTTLQVGLRWDDQSSAIQAMDVGANPVLESALTLPCITSLSSSCTGGSLSTQLPGIDYPGQDRELNWKSISPRIGLTYALGERKNTLLRAGFNRYTSQLGSTISSSSPVGNSQFTFLGIDTNGDHTIQRAELQKVRSFTGINPANPASLTSTRRIDYDMNPPTTDEFLIGAEHQLTGDFALGVTFTHRVNNDLPVVLFEKTQGAGNFYTSADYELMGNVGGTFTANGHTVTTGLTPVYQLKAGIASPVFGVITNRDDYSQTYNGLEFTATKRMSNKWMMRFNASYNDYTEDCGANAFANPTKGLPATTIVNGAAAYGGAPNCIGGQLAPQSAGSGAFGNVFIGSKYNANLSGIYEAPFGINIGANLLYRQGYPDLLRTTVSSLNGASPRGGAPTVALEEVGDRRFANVYQLDLRIGRDFNILQMGTINISADIFNATNERTVLQRNGLLSATATAFRITEMQAPRVYRIGGKFTFNP